MLFGRPITHLCRPRGFVPLDHLGEGLIHAPSLSLQQRRLLERGHPSGEGDATLQNTLLCCPRHDETVFHQTQLRVPPYSPTRSSILPVFKRLAACFVPHVSHSLYLCIFFYRHPLICCVLLSSTKNMRLYKQWHRPISKRFIKPPYSILREQPRSTRIVVA